MSISYIWNMHSGETEWNMIHQKVNKSSIAFSLLQAYFYALLNNQYHLLEDYKSVIVMKRNQYYQEEEQLLISKLSETNKNSESGPLDAENHSSYQLIKGFAGLTTGTCFFIHHLEKFEDINDESNDTEKREAIVKINEVGGFISDKEQNKAKDMVLQSQCEKQGQPSANVSEPIYVDPQVLEIRALLAEGLNDLDAFVRKQKERKIAFQKTLQELDTSFRVRMELQIQQKKLERQSRFTSNWFINRQSHAHNKKTEGQDKQKDRGSWFTAIKKWFGYVKEEEKKTE